MIYLPAPDLKYIVDVLSKHPMVKIALIFGSRAKGTHKPGSDIDLALKGDHLADVVRQVSAQLNEEGPLPYHVDVLDYDAITNENLKDHIDRVGIAIYPRLIETP